MYSKVFLHDHEPLLDAINVRINMEDVTILCFVLHVLLIVERIQTHTFFFLLGGGGGGWE